MHTAGSLLVGVDALDELPRVVKRLRAAVADTVQLVDGRRRPLVQVDLPIGLEGTAERRLSPPPAAAQPPGRTTRTAPR